MILIRKNKMENWELLSFFSISAYAISIWLLYAYTGYKASIEDWSAILDITISMTRISGIFLLVTLALNFWAYILTRTK